MEYYSIPLRVDELMKGKQLHSEVDIVKSIHENIRLILQSYLLSFRYDPNFGSLMNKYHANTPPQGKSERAWKEKIREAIQKNLKSMLQKYETRVKVKDVVIDIKHPKKKKDNQTAYVAVEIIGNLSFGRKEKFHYPDSEVSDEANEVFPLLIPVGK